MPKSFNPSVLPALKEALATTFWYKRQLRSHMLSCIADRSIVDRPDWDNVNKRDAVDIIVDYMFKHQNRHGSQLLELALSTADILDPRWLKNLEDGQDKYRTAVGALRSLRLQTDPYQKARSQEEEAQRRRAETTARNEQNQATKRELNRLQLQFLEVHSRAPQQRGFALEKLLIDLFRVFDLESKSSFKTVHEQIDGGFVLDGVDYLLEAKWTTELISLSDVETFVSKINRRIDNTLGLYFSFNGFKPSVSSIQLSGRPNVLLMDGADLLAVLDQRIGLTDLITRKRRHAALHAEIMLPISRILA